jgi:hypothetical protein
MSSHGEKVTAKASNPENSLTKDDAQAPATALVINAGAPNFMSKLAKELVSACLELEGMSLCGTFLDFSEPQVEIRYRVSVARLGIFPRTTQIEIFYAPGSWFIRFNTLEGVAYNLHLGVQPGTTEVGFFSESGMTFMGPEKAARFIVEPMVRRIRSEVKPAVS